MKDLVGGVKMLHRVSAMEKTGQGTACSKWQRGKKRHWELRGEEAEFALNREKIIYEDPEQGPGWREGVSRRKVQPYARSTTLRGAPSPGWSLFPLRRKAPGKEERHYWCCWAIWALLRSSHRRFFLRISPNPVGGVRKLLSAASRSRVTVRNASKPQLPPTHLLTLSPQVGDTGCEGNLAPCRDPIPGAVWPCHRPGWARRRLEVFVFHESRPYNWRARGHRRGAWIHQEPLQERATLTDESAGCQLAGRGGHTIQERAGTSRAVAVPWQPRGKPRMDLRDNAFSSCGPAPCLEDNISSKSLLAFCAGSRLKIL